LTAPGELGGRCGGAFTFALGEGDTASDPGPDADTGVGDPGPKTELPPASCGGGLGKGNAVGFTAFVDGPFHAFDCWTYMEPFILALPPTFPPLFPPAWAMGLVRSDPRGNWPYIDAFMGLVRLEPGGN